MKKITLLLPLLLCLIAGVQAQKPDMMQIVQKKFDMLNRHDLDHFADIYSDTARIESVGFDKPRTGIAGLKEAYGRYFKTSPDMTYTISRITAGADCVAVEYESVGTMTNLEGGSPEYMRGKKYTLKNCTVFHIQNGKITDESSYFDQLAFLRQMDYFNQKN